jgi:hypothetical protein
MKTKKFIIEPFGCDLVVSNDPAMWVELHQDPQEAFGITMTHKGKMHILLTERMCFMTIAHEAQHAARMINAAHGVDTDVDDHEMDCYMTEYITRLCLELYLKKSEIKITAFHK